MNSWCLHLSQPAQIDLDWSAEHPNLKVFITPEIGQSGTRPQADKHGVRFGMDDGVQL